MNQTGPGKKIAGSVLVLGLLAGVWHLSNKPEPAPWSESEIAILTSLSLASLPPLAPDPSNAVADDPLAAELGRALFSDSRLSGQGNVSCATCHQPDRYFTDGLVKGRALGVSKRHTPSLLGIAYSPWFYWDGRRDSQWSQALSPLEDPAEHGGNRMQYVRLIATDPEYRKAYTRLFGMPPDFSDHKRFPEAAAPVARLDWRRAWQTMSSADQHRVNQVFANMGKMLAAYERSLLPQPARFDAYVAAVRENDETAQHSLFNRDDVAGLRLFIGPANCTQCHNGPLLTNNAFHNTGVLPAPGEVPDRGRSEGVEQALADPFNCLGRYSDDPARQCPELTYVRKGIELLGAMKTPSLRNVADTAPYMHKGQLATLSEVLQHYNRASVALIGHNEAKPLMLGSRELRQLEAFLNTLTGPSMAASAVPEH
ncbi:MAG: cytochrome c peroxidase [Pseudomonadales bacterium]|nr:cytochrome c peroxidase [Pseudomonadales bacterium]